MAREFVRKAASKVYPSLIITYESRVGLEAITMERFGMA